MCEGETEMFKEKFAFLINPAVQRTGTHGRGMCVLPDGVGV
jgi:hypothetical protein